MTLIGLWPTGTAALFESEGSSRIRRRANATESKVRLVACSAAATPPRSRFSSPISTSRHHPISQKKEEKQMAKLYHVVWEIDVYAESPREAAKEAQQSSKTRRRWRPSLM